MVRSSWAPSASDPAAAAVAASGASSMVLSPWAAAGGAPAPGRDVYDAGVGRGGGRGDHERGDMRVVASPVIPAQPRLAARAPAPAPSAAAAAAGPAFASLGGAAPG